MTGKNSIATHPKFGIKGRILLLAPYKSIIDQMAKEAFDQQNRKNQLFVHSDIDKAVDSFQSKGKTNPLINYQTSIHTEKLSDCDDLVVLTTYDQNSNLSDGERKTFDYIFIDEVHALTGDVNFRSVTITNLIYDLLDFVRKNPESKTKIIFMSGTPDAESQVIPEIMKEYKIDYLLQKIKINKTYASTPQVNLVHLDTNDSKIRMDAVIRQMKDYYHKGKKVVFLLNNKKKMKKIHLIINKTIDKNCKVECFYSGSEGECTDAILSSKLGDYDIVLTTKYFSNGINITQDGLSKEDIESGKTSTQEYALIIDLGNQHSKTSAIGAIQTINRFRNRHCEATIFFPKIFKEDRDNPTRKFHYGNAAGVLLGINKYNFHLLSMDNEVKEPLKEVKEEVLERPVHIDRYRNNYESLNEFDLEKLSTRIIDKKELMDKVENQINIYESWYGSMDGYNYLCNDAGFKVDIMQNDPGESLKELSVDEIILENKFVENVVNEHKSIVGLFQHFIYNRKVFFESTDKVLDPEDTSFSINSVNSQIANKAIVKANLHSSNLRVVNSLFKSWYFLNTYYGEQMSLNIIRTLINDSDTLAHYKDKRYIKSISNYKDAISNITNDNRIRGLNYILTIDYLSQYVFEIEKKVKTDFIVYTIKKPEILNSLKSTWAKQQFEKISFNQNICKNNLIVLNGSSKLHLTSTIYNDKTKYNMMFNEKSHSFFRRNYSADYVKNHFTDEKVIKHFDFERLDYDLNQLTKYAKMSYSENETIKSYETIIIPRLIASDSLLKQVHINDNGYSEPEKVRDIDFLEKFKEFKKDLSKTIKESLKKAVKKAEFLYEHRMSYLLKKLKKNDFYEMIEYADFCLEMSKFRNMNKNTKIFKKIKSKFDKINDLYLLAFKATEYETFQNLKESKRSIFDSNLFLCDKDFELKELDTKQQKISGAQLKDTDIYDEIRKNSDKYLKTKTPRVTYKENKISLSRSIPEALMFKDTAYIVLDKKSNLLYASFDKGKACEYLCKYAYKNEGFVLKNGITPAKTENQGIYNPITFNKSYLESDRFDKTVTNYHIEKFEVTVLDYLDHVK